MTPPRTITQEEFSARFKARMVNVAGEKFDDGESIPDYAEEVAPAYYTDDYMLDCSPEDCADVDMEYWGE